MLAGNLRIFNFQPLRMMCERLILAFVCKLVHVQVQKKQGPASQRMDKQSELFVPRHNCTAAWNSGRSTAARTLSKSPPFQGNLCLQVAKSTPARQCTSLMQTSLYDQADNCWTDSACTPHSGTQMQASAQGLQMTCAAIDCQWDFSLM